MGGDATEPNIAVTVRERPAPRDSQPSVDRGEQIGRFVVLDMLGAGGMGVVYAAYDPSLDRKVAIKVLGSHAMGSEEARTRLLREAQAMARIDHPNVLRVHEAGRVGERVYIAMEFASRGTLREWLTAHTRTRGEIIGLFVQAGRGLAAAHAAGLVHRDFKPDNVLLVEDGEVRVTDFGLVGVVTDKPSSIPPPDADKPISENTALSSDLTRTGTLMGTPAYMAPEQFRGGTIGPAADQFSFAVSLYEALYGERPFAGETTFELGTKVEAGAVSPAPEGSDVPARIRRVLLRGLATAPDDRFASMDDLMSELVPEANGRKRVVIAASVAAALALGALALFALRGERSSVCSGGDARASVVWGPKLQHDLGVAFASSDRPDAPAVLTRVVPLVDRWSRDWQQAYVSTCADTRIREVQSEHVMDLRMDCLGRELEEARQALVALADGGGDAVDHALDVVRALPPVNACSDSATLTSGIAPPGTPELRTRVDAIRATIARARAQRQLAHYSDAVVIAHEAIGEARAAGYDPVTAQALLELGRSQTALADPKWDDALAEAMRMATASRDSDTAVLAAAVRISSMSHHFSKLAVADELEGFADAYATQASLQPTTRVELDLDAATLDAQEGKQDAAQARYDRAMQVATTQLGADAPEARRALQGMGALAADRHKFADAQKVFQQVLAGEERLVGKDHPDYADAVENYANVLVALGRDAETKELREEVLRIRTAALGPTHPDVARAYDALAGFYYATGDFGTATTYYEKALAAYAPDNVVRTSTLLNFGMELRETGNYARSRTVLEEARALREKAYGPDDPRVGIVLMHLGLLAKSQKQYDKAIELIQASHRIAERAYGPTDGDALDALGNLSTAYLDAERLPEAREQMDRLIGLFTEVDGADGLRVGLTLANYGLLQLKLDDGKGALASFERARPILEAKLGKTHPNVGFVVFGAGRALVALHRVDEALPLFERALEVTTAAKVAPIQLGEMHYYLATALITKADMRSRARAEMTASLALYEQANDKSDAELARRWLQAH